MAFPTLRSNHSLQRRAQLLSVRRNQTQALNDKQMRASTSLCQLSDNICFEDEKYKSKTGINKHLQAKDVEGKLSPWMNKFTHQSKINQQQNRIPSLNYSAHLLLRRPQVKKSLTENAENHCILLKSSQKQTKLLKISSIFDKRMQVKREDKKLNLKLDDKQLKSIILMCKRKKYSLQTNAVHNLMQQKSIQTQPLIAQICISNILNTNHANYPKQKVVNKNFITKANMDVKMDELIKFKDTTDLINDHWNAKTLNSKSRNNKKIGITRATFKKETYDLSHKLYPQRKYSLDAKSKKEQYKGINQLANLLYEKYLHTIGVKS